MRSDINILWIEDSPKWQEKTEKLFRLRIEQFGLLTNIKYISEGIPLFFEQIKNESKGYKIYDIIFIDYNISGEKINDNKSEKITGDKVIEEFRKYEIDADILFYSENLKESADFQKDEKKKILLNSSVAFEGIYLASRKDFLEHALKLYRKNIRKLTSMLNIRGLLTDKTSENDYVINSYLLEKFDDLEDDSKKNLSQYINSMITEQLNTVKSKCETVQKLLKNDLHKIKQIYNLPDYLFPIAKRYELFSKLLKLENDKHFEKYTINEYQEKIIKTRNTVAHKKIDICEKQQYLKYYDTLKQCKNRRCQNDCSAHTDDYKISVDNWNDILKLANEYSKIFDTILMNLENE